MGASARDGRSRSAVDHLLAARTPVMLLLLTAGLLYALWWGWTNAIAPPPERPASAICATKSPTPFSVSGVTVGVYNGGARSGMAGEVAESLRKAGFAIKTIANTDERITATVVRGARADAVQVQLVAAFFSGAQVQADGRANDTVDVLVGTEFQPMVMSAPTVTMLPPEGCAPTVPATPAAPSAPSASAAPSAPPS